MPHNVAELCVLQDIKPPLQKKQQHYFNFEEVNQAIKAWSYYTNN